MKQQLDEGEMGRGSYLGGSTIITPGKNKRRDDLVDPDDNSNVYLKVKRNRKSKGKAADYVSKPFNPELLRFILECALSEKHGREWPTMPKRLKKTSNTGEAWKKNIKTHSLFLKVMNSNKQEITLIHYAMDCAFRDAKKADRRPIPKPLSKTFERGELSSSSITNHYAYKVVKSICSDRKK